ncbi:embryonic polyadenylate-binding protein 2-B-like [Ara ararauna]
MSWLGFQELQVIKARAQEMEKEAAWMRELQPEVESSLAGNLEAALSLKEIHDKTEVDQRSIYVGNVDYGATAEELESFFLCCGKINRVTILCDRFLGHPKGYAYIEFEEQSSMKAAMALHESLFRGRVIKVLPKRTNVPGISTTNRGGYQGHFQACRGLAKWGSYYGKQYTHVRGRAYGCVPGGGVLGIWAKSPGGNCPLFWSYSAAWLCSWNGWEEGEGLRQETCAGNISCPSCTVNITPVPVRLAGAWWGGKDQKVNNPLVPVPVFIPKESLGENGVSPAE